MIYFSEGDLNFIFLQRSLLSLLVCVAASRVGMVKSVDGLFHFEACAQGLTFVTTWLWKSWVVVLFPLCKMLEPFLVLYCTNAVMGVIKKGCRNH